jgi:hypothetical protein
MPDWTEQLRARLGGLRLSASRKAEIIEELSQHLEQRYDDRRVRSQRWWHGVGGLLLGQLPAWQASEFSSAQVIASDGRTVTGRGGSIRSVLVGGQVAIAVTLLFGAGLLLRTLLAVEGVDRGYQAESALAMLVAPPGPRRVPWLSFYEAVAQEVRALPGVRDVAWATTLHWDVPIKVPFSSRSWAIDHRQKTGGRRLTLRS